MKNIDELFAEAKKSKVPISVDAVAKTLIAGAAITGTTTAATAATVTGKSILTLSTPTIMTGTIVTAAAVTATTIAVVNSNKEEQTPSPTGLEEKRKIAYVEEPTTETAAEEETTIDYLEAIEGPIHVEEVIVDEEFTIQEEERIESNPAPTDQEGRKEDRIVLSSSDSREDFDRKVELLKKKGYDVDVDKVVLNGEKSKLSMNFIKETESGAICGNVELSGPFEVILEWGDNNALSVSNSGSGSVNVVDTESVERNGRSEVRVTTNSTKNSKRKTNTTKVITDKKGNTTIINSSDDDSDTINVNMDQLRIDMDELMEDVNHQIEIQMESFEIELEDLDVQMEQLFEQLEKLNDLDLDEFDFDFELEEKKKEKEKEKVKEAEKEKAKEKEKKKDKEDEKDEKDSRYNNQDQPSSSERVEVESPESSGIGEATTESSEAIK